MFSGLESPMHLLVVLIVAILVLGPKKLPDAARGLGSGIRQFKDSIEGKETAAPTAAAPVTAPAPVSAPGATSASIEATPVAAETE
jgi:sec-independent protein translocase protein TatA